MCVAFSFSCAYMENLNYFDLSVLDYTTTAPLLDELLPPSAVSTWAA